MIRLVNSVAGLAVGASLSQFPEYSQQYVQRLGGAVDELTIVVEDFDATAAQSDLTRDAALAQMQGTEFIEGRREDMTRTIDRQETLAANYDQLRDADAFSRLSQINKFGDSQITQRAWDDFQPAIPITIEGAVMLLGGYLAGFYIFAAFFALIKRGRQKRRIKRRL